MSSAELDLGAKLFLDAVNADLPEFLDAKQADHTEIRNLKLAMRDVGQFMRNADLVGHSKENGWAVKDDNFAKITDAQDASFLPYYQTAVFAHERAAGILIAGGKSDYVENFREIHGDMIFEVQPETVTRVRGQDMEAIASASLELLEASRKDPANAAFVKGLSQEAQDDLWSILEGMNYLMPGENPDRAAPIGEQPLRGTQEQQEALFHQASALAANIEMPETLTPGDRPMAAAIMLRNTIAGAEVEEYQQATFSMASHEYHHDSDLHPDSANALFNVLTTGSRMAFACEHTSQLDVLSCREELVDAVRTAFIDYDELLVDNALTSGNFEAPGIDAKKAQRISAAIGHLRDAVTHSPEELLFTGDDGGSLTEEGATIEADAEAAFDAEADGEGAATESLSIDDDGDMAADIYGKSDPYAKVNQSLMDEFLAVSQECLMDGSLESIRRNANRAEIDLTDYASTAAFATFDDAMGANRVATTPEMTSRVSEAMSLKQFNNLNPRVKSKLKPSVIDPAHEPFKGYRPGSPATAAERFNTFVDANLVKDGQANNNMRRWLRQASSNMVVGLSSPQEAEAGRAYAQKFIEREAAELAARRDAKNEKIGFSSFDLDAAEVKRAIAVARDSAEGDKTNFRVHMIKDGGIKVSHPDAPQMTSRLENAPKELANADKSPRDFGGFLSYDQLRAAYETGAEKITVSMMGETVRGAYGKVAEEPQRTVSKPKRKFEDMVLS